MVLSLLSTDGCAPASKPQRVIPGGLGESALIGTLHARTLHVILRPRRRRTRTHKWSTASSVPSARPICIQLSVSRRLPGAATTRPAAAQGEGKGAWPVSIVNGRCRLVYHVSRVWSPVATSHVTCIICFYTETNFGRLRPLDSSNHRAWRWSKCTSARGIRCGRAL